MAQPTYRRLVENVRRDGRLTSVPFACLDEPPPAEPVYEVLSGNHRVQAAVDAGLEQIEVMVTDTHLDRRQRTAIQLSHNALAGDDDPAVLKRLYESLDVDWKSYSGLDDKTLGLLAKVQPGSLGEANLDFQVLSIVFLPGEMDRLKAALDAARPLLKGSDARWAMRWADYDRLLDRLADASAAKGVTNVATAMMALLSIVERHLHELAEGWEADGELLHKGRVPIAALFGDGRMPAEEARKVSRAVEKMKGRGELEGGQAWRALASWAEAYLS